MAPIHEAVRQRDVEALRRELERGVDPDLRVSETDYRTPLQLLPRGSFETRNAEILQCHRLLLENGASVDVRDSINDTALHDACLFGNSALVKLLIEAGADVHARGCQQNTPLHQVKRHGSIARLLLRAGAEVNARNEYGLTPLEHALEYPMTLRVFPILLRAGSDLPAETDDPYIQRVIDAGGWANYERHHLDKLTAMLTPTPTPTDGRRRSRRRLSPLRRVPPEVIRRIVAYAFHAGYY